MTKKKKGRKTRKSQKKRKMTEKKKKTERKTQEKEKAFTVGTRGRIFEGRVIRKFPKRVAIEFERMVYDRKYERYARFRTKIHARLPESMEKEINIGDLIQVRECRPLSKIIHFIVIKKIKESEEKAKKQGGKK